MKLTQKAAIEKLIRIIMHRYIRTLKYPKVFYIKIKNKVRKCEIIETYFKFNLNIFNGDLKLLLLVFLKIIKAEKLEDELYKYGVIWYRYEYTWESKTTTYTVQRKDLLGSFLSYAAAKRSMN